jgi:hypothetical protein
MYSCFIRLTSCIVARLKNNVIVKHISRDFTLKSIECMSRNTNERYNAYGYDCSKWQQSLLYVFISHWEQFKNYWTIIYNSVYNLSTYISFWQLSNLCYDNLNNRFISSSFISLQFTEYIPLCSLDFSRIRLILEQSPNCIYYFNYLILTSKPQFAWLKTFQRVDLDVKRLYKRTLSFNSII